MLFQGHPLLDRRCVIVSRSVSPQDSRTVEVLVVDDDARIFHRIRAFEIEPLPGHIAVLVEIDIKPGSDPNSIQCHAANKVITVAILTTEDFDATTVDHSTIRFESASETHIDRRSGEPRRHEEDVDYDGDLDLVFHFRLGDTDISCASLEGTLMGQTFGGLPLEGTDAVRMLGD